MYFISLNLLIEVLALYSAIGYFTEYKYFGLVKETSFAANFWLYNLFEVFSVSFLLFYFGRLLKSKRSISILIGLGTTFVLSSLLVFIFNKTSFFNKMSSYVTITGSFLLLIGIGFYLIEVLKGKVFLKEQAKFPLYVMISAGISYLASLPFLIYSYTYHHSHQEEFVKLYIRALQITNIIVYFVIITGFVLCLSKKKT